MRLGGRLQAAIEVLQDIETQHRPASVALADWGRAHRFAGAGDRAAIGNLVYDALRKKASHGWRMGDHSPRALVLAVAVFDWKESADTLITVFEGDKHAPAPLTDAEKEAFQNQRELKTAPVWVQADCPEWVQPLLQDSFGEDYVAEAQAMTLRPPTDLRVNRLKAEPEKILKALDRYGILPAPITAYGLRLSPPEKGGRSVNVLPEAGYQKGWFEIQDAGSQIIAELVKAKPGEQILDYCAGAGGKTLALAAAMENKGQIHAYDKSRSRLAPIHERLKRAGTRNVQVLAPSDSLDALQDKMDCVVIDAPCTGSGTWRRRPDTKWKLTQKSLSERIEEQRVVLHEAARFVKSKGRLCYMTCSVLKAENENQIAGFLKNHPDFELRSALDIWKDLYPDSSYVPRSSDGKTLLLTPASTETDGFFFAVLYKK